MNVTAVFDIGKTNKKFFLFDERYQQVYKEYKEIGEIADDDGHPADDLTAIREWIFHTLDKVFQKMEFEIKAINFSTYGASFVHVDDQGNALTPLYNYTKPFPQEVLQDFYRKYGTKIARETASPPAGMLNSGLQLYWLKHTKPKMFKRIRWSLHFPQYLSFLFTGIPVSDFTSIGCHTGLWDFDKGDYHHWVYEEGIDRILPPITSTDTTSHSTIQGKQVAVGVGIHDSSAALLPYIRANKKPFLLLSTGTWSITLNPFNAEPLHEDDLQGDCLSYMSIEGRPVRAARLFLGNEYNFQIKQLADHFQKSPDHHRGVKFNHRIYSRLNNPYQRYFRFDNLHLDRKQPEVSEVEKFDDYEIAYHQLMMELVELQIISTQKAIGNSHINTLYIDGGFADNQLYTRLLSLHFKDYRICTTQSPLGSSIGAAIVMAKDKLAENFLLANYNLRALSSIAREK